jgi:hypothetical protein
VNEEGEEVAGVIVGIAALLDDAVDDLREFADGALGLKIATRWEPLGSHDEAAKVGGVFEKDLEIFADLRRVMFDIGVEESFANDPEGEAHHGVVEIDGLARPPGFEELLGAGSHGGGVIGDAVAVKGGLHHAALAEPEITFAGEQAIAEDMPICAKDAALDEFLGVVDQNVFDLVGVEEQVGAYVKEPQADDVAVFAGGARHETERILAERAAEAVEEALFGAGRVKGHLEMVRGNG